MDGSIRLRPKYLAEVLRIGVVAMMTAGATVMAPAEEGLRPYKVVGDAIPSSLTGQRGDPARGRVYRVDGLSRVAANFSGKPILTAEQIEDVVAYLTTLRD